MGGIFLRPFFFGHPGRPFFLGGVSQNPWSNPGELPLRGDLEIPLSGGIGGKFSLKRGLVGK